VALAISAVVAPCFRRRRSRTIAFLVSARASDFGRTSLLLASFVTRYLVAVAFDGFLAAGPVAFLLARVLFGGVVPGLEVSVAGAIVGSVVMMLSPYSDVADDTFIAPVGTESEAIFAKAGDKIFKNLES